MLAAVRLQWWREVVDEAADGRPRAHPAAAALAELFARSSPSVRLFSDLLDAREFDFGPEAFADLAALEAYCEATSSGVMKIAAHVLGARADDYLRHAGIAYALAGLLRSIPFHAARRKLYVPLDILSAAGLDPEAVFSRSNDKAFGPVLRRLGAHARQHLAHANALRAPSGAFIAALPAALVGLHLRPLVGASFGPTRAGIEMPVYRRQLSLLRAALCGRL